MPDSSDSQAPPPRPWSLSVFGGQFFHDHLQDILFRASAFSEPQFRNSHVVVFSVGKGLAVTGRVLSWEIEGQVGKHFGMQDHLEFNSALVARWLPFPWDGVVQTSLAVGDGFSFATGVPATEASFKGRRGYQLLNYLMVELTLSHPRAPAWELLARVHHRSGVYGLYGTREGSNFLGLGVRRVM